MGAAEVLLLVLAAVLTAAYFAGLVVGFKIVTKRLIWRDTVEKLLSGLTVAIFIALALFIPLVLYLMYTAALT